MTCNRYQQTNIKSSMQPINVKLGLFYITNSQFKAQQNITLT